MAELSLVRRIRSRISSRTVIPLLLAGLFGVYFFIQPATRLQPTISRMAERLPYVRAAEEYQSKFVFALSQPEQTLSAVRNILQLGHLFSPVNASLVEPFMIGTRLFGLPPRRRGAADCHGGEAAPPCAQPLSKVLDLAKVIQECGYDIPVPASFSTFLRTSARQLVLLYPFKDEWESDNATNRQLSQCIQTGNPVCDCRKIIPFSEAARNVLEVLNRERPHDTAKFEFVKIICFSQHWPMTLQSLLQQSDNVTDSVRLSQSHPVSYIFPHWKGSTCEGLQSGNENDDTRTVVANDPAEAVLALQGKQRIDGVIKGKCPKTTRVHLVPLVSFPSMCTKSGSLDKAFVFIDVINPFLKQLAVTFVNDQSLVDVSKMVSIHFRTEWLVKISQSSNRPAWIDCCMEELNQVLGTISQELQLSIRDNSILVSDIGPQGTTSCDSRAQCNTTTLGMISKLRQQHQLKPVSFNPSKYNADDDPITASLVEHLALAQGRYLVVIGGGKFQRAIVTSALHVGNVKKIYSVCSLTTKSGEGIPAAVEFFSLNSCLIESEMKQIWVG